MDEAQGIQVLRQRHRDGLSVSFTGTRVGMNEPQWETLNDLFPKLFDRDGLNYWHNGDCVGADEQAHTMVWSLKRVRGYTIVTHGYPALVSGKFRAGSAFDRVHTAMPPLVRDLLMVDAAHVTVATPRLMKEERRSGTWASIRYARKTHTPLFIVWPDGRIQVEIEEGLFD